MGLAFGNNIFVAGTYGGGNIITYSTNGLNWTSSGVEALTSRVATGYGGAITYSGTRGVWVAACGGGNSIIYSADGIRWTGSGTQLSGGMSGVGYGNGIWVGCSGSAGGFGYSTNATNWTAYASVPFTASHAGYSPTQNIWVATGSGNLLMYSINAINWTNASLSNGIGGGPVSFVLSNG